MVAPVKITQSSVALKIPATTELVEGGLAVNVVDGALYSARHDGSIIRIEGDTGNGSIASDASIALGGVMAGVVEITGTATIAAIVLREGQTRTVRFTGALTLANSAALALPGGVDIATIAGDFATFRGYAAGVTRCTNYGFSPTKFASLAGSPTQNFSAAAGTFSTLTATSGSAAIRGLTLVGAATTQGSMRFGSSNDFYKISGGPDYLGVVYEVAASASHQFNVGSVKAVISSVGLTVTGNITCSTGFGCNGTTAQVSFSVGAAATDLATAIALVNKLRTMVINNGLGA